MIPKRKFRLLSQDEAFALRVGGLTPRAALARGLIFPVGGGEEFDPDTASEDDLKAKAGELDIEGADSLSTDDLKKKVKEALEAAGGSGGGGGDDDDDGTVKVDKKELDDLKRKVAEQRRAEKKREKEEREARDRQRAEQGKYEEIAKDAQEERDVAIKEKETAEGELQKFKAQITISKVAQRLNFKDPTDAVRFLDEELRSSEDEKAIEKALSDVLKEKGYLKNPRQATGGGHDGGGANGGAGGDVFTKEQMEAMTSDEINEHWDKVQRSMARLGAAAGS